MARYLVTGGCGFIGSHLTDELLKKGHSVIVLDNLTTGKRANLNQEVELVVGDICDRELVDRIITKCDGCFHLAAIPSVQESVNHWVETNRTNLVGMITLLDAAIHLHQEQAFTFAYASSAAVYADDNHPPLKESDRLAPISPYGVDKLSCELQAKIAGKLHHLPNVGLRIFNVYGERQNPNSAYSGVISVFLNRLIHKQPVIIYGDGEQVRDFIYVKDVVACFISALQQATTDSPVFNACSGNGTTLNQLVHFLKQIYKINPKVIHAKPRDGDLRESIGDPSLTNLRLHVQNRTSLIHGLTRLCENVELYC